MKRLLIVLGALYLISGANGQSSFSGYIAPKEGDSEPVTKAKADLLTAYQKAKDVYNYVQVNKLNKSAICEKAKTCSDSIKSSAVSFRKKYI